MTIDRPSKLLLSALLLAGCDVAEQRCADVATTVAYYERCYFNDKCQLTASELRTWNNWEEQHRRCLNR